MNNSIDVAIIGAGPYGLSLAAYLANAGIEFRIFGKIMESWKTKMPPGMLLKSYPWASCLYDPTSSLTLKQFYADRGIPYDDSLISVPLQTFMAYGEAFQARFVPNVENKMLISIKRSTEGFQAVFDDGEVLKARQMVIAVGVHPFKYVPSNLSHLPAEFFSHSCEYGSLEGFTEKEVAILGSGSSATDLAALLYHKEAKVTLIARATELPFMPVPEIKNILSTKLRQLASPLKPLKRLLSPNSCIGSTWLLKVCANTPKIFHSLPEKIRLDIVRNQLGPSGHWTTKKIVEGHVQLNLGRNLEFAEIRNGKINLRLSTRDGATENLQADHLIAATGYKIDLTQLRFLDKLLPDIHGVENAPILTINYESSVPGLYFIGPASVNSFGPVVRFVCGAIHSSRRITQHLSEKSKSHSRVSYQVLPNKDSSKSSVKEDSSLSKEAESALSTRGTHAKLTSTMNVLLLSAMFRTPYRVLRCVHSADANVFVLGTEGAKGLKSSRYCKAFISTDRPINGSFDAELAEQINRHIASLRIDVVLAGDTPSTRSLIMIRKLLKAPCFPMPDLDTFDLLNNKWEFYLLCKSLGIQ
jgi:thioredoxin reductase